MALLTANNLVKKYGDFTAVDHISFSLEEGEIFGLLGPNGAGKTTTINMLTGLARITSGSVHLEGLDYTNSPQKAQEIMGIIPDESNLYDELTGFENLCFCGALYGLRKQKRKKRARQLLQQFQLVSAQDKPFKTYSKGMKRKLTIAAGIIHEPKILFLDEPTTGIDVASARQIRRLLLNLNKNGTTMFLTTHYIEEAERLCHRIALIMGGKIVRLGTTAELMQEAQKETIVEFTLENGACDLREDLQEQFPGFSPEFLTDNVIRIHSSVPIDLKPFMRFFDERELPVYEARILRPSLEEVFVKVTGIEPEEMKEEKEGYKK